MKYYHVCGSYIGPLHVDRTSTIYIYIYIVYNTLHDHWYKNMFPVWTGGKQRPILRWLFTLSGSLINIYVSFHFWWWQQYYCQAFQCFLTMSTWWTMNDETSTIMSCQGRIFYWRMFRGSQRTKVIGWSEQQHDVLAGLCDNLTISICFFVIVVD